MKNALLSTATAGFAHLLGRETAQEPPRSPPAAAKTATNDKQQEGESDEHFEERRSRDSAESDDVTQGDDESDDDFQKRKKKKDDDKEAAAAALGASATAVAIPVTASHDILGGDRSDADDLRGDAVVASARLRERARCEAIFLDPAAGKNAALAATLAFQTDLPRGQAIKVLRSGGLAVVGPRNTLDRRMAALGLPPVTASEAARPVDTQPSAYSDATKVVVAGMRRRGESDASIQAFLTSRTGPG